MRLGATLILSAMTAASVRVAAQSSPPAPTVPPPAAPAAPASGPMIQVDEATYDFGKAAVGEKVRHTYQVTNTGNETLEITNVRPGCHCTTAGDWTHSIAPGHSGGITVQFDTTGFGGGPPITRTIDVYSNAKNEPRKTLLLRGKVWKPIEITPTFAMISIPPDATNEVSTTVRIANQTDQPMTISNVISANRLFTAVLREIKPGKEFDLGITAQPPYATGHLSGTITLNTSLSNTPVISVPVSANVTPAVMVYPSQIVLNSLPDRWTTNPVTIYGNTTNVLLVSNPKASDSRIEVQVRPQGLKGRFSLLVAFPPGFHPEPGQRPEVSVESNHPRFPVIKIPIMEYPRRPVASLPVGPHPPQVAGHP